MILLHAAGGPGLGVGHLSRCRSLAAAAAPVLGPAVLLFEAPEDLAERFSWPGVRTVAVPDRVAALEARGAMAMEAEGPRILVTDLMGLTRSDSDLARAQGFDLLVHVEDDTRSGYAPDLVVDGSGFLAPVHAGQVPPVRLQGPGYHILRPEVVAARPAAPWAGARARRILVTLGGADPGHMTEALLRSLAGAPRGASSLPALTVVVGPQFGRGRSRGILALLPRGAELLPAPRDLTRAILDHDLVVTLGGLTSYEAMCLGRPVASVPWAHMAHYVTRLADAGLLWDLGDDPGPALLTLAEYGRRLTDMARRGFGLLDGRGAERIVDAVVGILG